MHENPLIECELERGHLVMRPIMGNADVVLCEVSGFKALEGRESGQLHFEQYRGAKAIKMKVTDDE